MLSVSIVTISQYSRKDFLLVLAECIKKQTYTNIKEWVIVDTSHVGYQKTVQTLEELVKELREDVALPEIVYHQATRSNIGGWRNESLMLPTGDIVVCMDDDDYYPPQRVSHAVDKLKDKKTLIAGCDKLYFYDIHHRHMYQFNGFGINHSTNNCMAYWREYGKEHSYDETVEHAEENKFTNNFTVPMTQLDPDKTILQFSHDTNTYNKKKIILTNICAPPEQKYITKQMFTVEDFIKDKKITDAYQKIFDRLTAPQECPYDIVYYTGLSVPWSPQQKDLGGSEQAVQYLSAEWARIGKKVAVYGNLIWEGVYQGVVYLDCKKFRFWDKFKVLILWRLFGCYPFLTYDLKADKILVDIHDHSLDMYSLMMQNSNKIDKWMVKSEFHKDLIESTLGIKIPNIVVVPNGIRIADFEKPIAEKRIPFRMCYCSCYSRGLYRILKDIWPIIYKFEPRAELHVYYGMKLIPDPKFKEEMVQLLSQPGVMDHGRQPVEIINREKHLSTFHLYYTDSLSEIDCITIRESLVAGCIPIISNINVFKYRDGIHISWLPNLPDFNYQVACGIVELIHNENLQNDLRERLKKSSTIVSWKEVADTWLELISA